MTVLDSSALLAIVLGEPGAARGEAELDQSPATSTVNVTEVLTRAADDGKGSHGRLRTSRASR